MSSTPGGAQRRASQRSLGGLVGALVAVFGLIAVVWGLTWFSHHDLEDPARTVDYAPALAAARAQAPFAVLSPDPVPLGLRATSVSWDGTGATKSWQLGFVTDGGEFVGLYEGNGPPADVIEASTPARDPGSPVTISGAQWLTLTNDARGETAFVRTTSGVTTVVTGTAGPTVLTSFAATLH